MLSQLNECVPNGLKQCKHSGTIKTDLYLYIKVLKKFTVSSNERLNATTGIGIQLLWFVVIVSIYMMDIDG